ncbi:MAG: CBS domain-containing protein [Candidatus Absconditabacterales bacterium]|nr:CBS domain-containing protein [Candidatus Absconditabacterales bacterium]
MHNQKTKKQYDKKSDLIVEFLALFNQIDKHFDKLLGIDNFIPFNEKIKRISKGDYHISWFVKLNQYQIKHFGEIRNELTHGIKLDGYSYVYPSDYAMSQLKKYVNVIKKPFKCIDLFKRPVFTCTIDDNLKKILKIMDKNNYSHVPVYGENKNYLGLLAESEVLAWLTEGESSKDMGLAKVGDIPLLSDLEYIIFVDKKCNVYEIDKLFAIKKQRRKKLGVILITENGDKNEKILGIITAGDTALIDAYVVR